jgi:hypothetical protein
MAIDAVSGRGSMYLEQVRAELSRRREGAVGSPAGARGEADARAAAADAPKHPAEAGSEAAGASTYQTDGSADPWGTLVQGKRPHEVHPHGRGKHPARDEETADEENRETLVENRRHET